MTKKYENHDFFWKNMKTTQFFLPAPITLRYHKCLKYMKIKKNLKKNNVKTPKKNYSLHQLIYKIKNNDFNKN